MRTLTGSLLALTLLFGGAAHAAGNTQQQQVKDAKRYGAGSTVTRSKQRYKGNFFYDHEQKIEVKKADGSRSTMQRWTGKRDRVTFVSTVKEQQAPDGTSLSRVEIRHQVDERGPVPIIRHNTITRDGAGKTRVRAGSFKVEQQ